MSAFAPTHRLARVELREETPQPRTPEVQQELDVALFDLGEDNRFRPLRSLDGAVPEGPYALTVGLAGGMLGFEIATEEGTPVLALRLSLTPLRALVEDYAAVCERYHDAVRRLPAAQIEAIDMGRRGIHEEGARIVADRLEGKVETDHETARRLFTVIAALCHRD